MKKIVSIAKTYLRRIAMTVGIFPTCVTFLDYVAYVAYVDGQSMQPTFNEFDDQNRQQYQDYVLLSHYSARKYDIKRGQIVAFISPEEPNQRTIKRVVALEGDTVVTRPNCKQRKVVVPEGHCWVEGDNHSNSLDSNMSGPVAVGLITAKAVCIVWPPERWQKLEHRIPNDRTVIFNPNNCLVTCNIRGINYNDSGISLIE